MVSTFKSFAQYFRTYPLRGVLTLVTIAIGVGALIITFSLTFDVNAAVEESLSRDGAVIVVANSEIGDDGDFQRQIPSGFDGDVTSILSAEYENIRDATLVGEARWSRVLAGGTSYQVRSAIAAGAGYDELLNLDMAAGSFFEQTDVENRRQVVVISESTARILFGNAENAVGEQVQTAVPSFAAGQGRVRVSQEPFTVIGVYTDVSELKRESYGVGDFIIPIGTNLPAGIDITFDPDSVVMARLINDTTVTAESRIGVILETAYGDDTLVAVWEGSPSGPQTLIAESRRAVSSFAVTINVLGIIILVASSIGIFSIMLVEVLNRMREIGLRRAIGATRAGIRRFFMLQALYFSIAGSAIGAGLSFVFYRVVGASLVPFFETAGLSAADLNLTVPGVLPIALAVTSAVVVGSLFGLFPAISASRTPIVECIREEAA